MRRRNGEPLPEANDVSRCRTGGKHLADPQRVDNSWQYIGQSDDCSRLLRQFNAKRPRAAYNNCP